MADLKEALEAYLAKHGNVAIHPVELIQIIDDLDEAEFVREQQLDDDFHNAQFPQY